MTEDGPFKCVLDVRARLGECPLWAADERVLYWVDIKAPTLNRFDPATGKNHVMPMSASIGSFALRETGGFVIALRSGLWLASADGHLERCIVDPPYDPAHHRFNDGRCDPQGRFVVGSMNENRDADTGALYRLDNDFALTRLFGQMTISNGLAFSPDGTTMYHADTPTRTVRAYDYAPDASLPKNPRVFAQWDNAADRPDGAAVDSAGNYWVAHYHAGHIVQLSASGKTLATYPIPAMCPTMCAFGGDDLRTLYVTTARQMRDDAELARFPQSGSIFSMRVDAPGLPEPRFRG